MPMSKCMLVVNGSALNSVRVEQWPVASPLLNEIASFVHDMCSKKPGTGSMIVDRFSSNGMLDAKMLPILCLWVIVTDAMCSYN